MSTRSNTTHDGVLLVCVWNGRNGAHRLVTRRKHRGNGTRTSTITSQQRPERRQSMARIRRPGAAIVALGVAVALCLTACSSGMESSDTSSGKKVSGKISLVYLQKQGDQQYFIDEAQGAKDKARELGSVDVKVVNLGNGANKAVSEAQAAVAQKANNVIIVPPDPAVGPQIVQTAGGGKVTLLSSDDQVCKNGPDPAKCAKDQ